jgi:HSP20 family protein
MKAYETKEHDMIWPLVSAFDVTTDPFGELQRLQREVGRIFHEGTRWAAEFPALNVSSSDEEASVTAAVPGLRPEDLSLTVEGRVLSVEGERKPETPNDLPARRERFVGKFSRQIRLPFDVAADRVTAKYANGLVHITLPRREESKPRRISVQAG